MKIGLKIEPDEKEAPGAKVYDTSVMFYNFKYYKFVQLYLVHN